MSATPLVEYKIFSGDTLVTKFNSWIVTKKYLSENEIVSVRLERSNPRDDLPAQDLTHLAQILVKKA